MSCVGIDLAGVDTRPTGFCVLRGMDAETELLLGDEEVVDRKIQADPKVIAVDAPPALPTSRHCLEEHCRGKQHFRKCDLELRGLGIRFFPITLGPMCLLTKRGMSLRPKLEATGFIVVETYPGGAQDLLGIKRRSDLEGLRDGLRGLGNSGEDDKSRTSDHELDTVTCAFVAKLYAEGEYLSLGDPRESLMVLLNRRAGILK